ncbi:hypothetical protein [Streptomyces nogalater]|uniref:Uncharacterized protein n=1 Tax=Streptomyces nogalater TaxID=38314 RepID=A0ABW0WBZ7_STRNO
MSRVVRDPNTATVAAIRKHYGLVFQHDLLYSNYYEVLKNGQTHAE